MLGGITIELFPVVSSIVEGKTTCFGYTINCDCILYCSFFLTGCKSEAFLGSRDDGTYSLADE